MGAQLLHGHASGLQILLQGHALGLQVPAQLVDQAVQLVFHHSVGDDDGHALRHLADQVVGELLRGLGLLLLHGGLHNGAAQGGHIGEALLPGEFIVPLRGGAAGDLMYLDAEHRVLAGQFGDVFRGERHLHVPLLAHGGAGYLLLKAGDEVAAAQQQGILLALAALERHAVHEALKVQRDLVAHGGLLRVPDGGVLLRVLGQRGLGIIAAELHLRIDGGKALVLPQLHLRVQVDNGGEGVAVGADGLHRQGGGTGDLDVVLADGLHQRLGIGVVHRVLVQELGAVFLLDVLTGGLALHGEHGLHALIAACQGLLPCLLIHGDGQAYLALFGDVLPHDDLHTVTS